jgi:hypothetical protein
MLGESVLRTALEAYEAYGKMPMKWPTEPQMRLLVKDVFRKEPGRVGM